MDTLDSTLDQHLDQHLIDTPLPSWSTDGRHSANYQSSVNRAPTKRDVGQDVDGCLIKYINQHSAPDAFSTLDPIILSRNLR